MRKVVVFTNLTLDGVMQSPAGPDEDQRGGFTQGGWAAPYGAMQSSEIGDSLGNIGPLLFGRWTYENFYSFWPSQTGSPFRDVLNNAQKYVASRTLNEPLSWQNSTLLKGDAADALVELKAQPGKDFLVMGSGALVRSLMRRGLVDRYVLLIHPIILGSGRRLFPDDRSMLALQLISANTTPKGVVVAVYEPAAAG
jgi:dihydrofolate reductase